MLASVGNPDNPLVFSHGFPVGLVASRDSPFFCVSQTNLNGARASAGRSLRVTKIPEKHKFRNCRFIGGAGTCFDGSCIFFGAPLDIHGYTIGPARIFDSSNLSKDPIDPIVLDNCKLLGDPSSAEIPSARDGRPA